MTRKTARLYLQEGQGILRSAIWPVASAKGVYLTLADGTELIDGMSSWWSTIHGYSHPKLVAAICDQAHTMSHVMFGGLTHEPAINLAKLARMSISRGGGRRAR